MGRPRSAPRSIGTTSSPRQGREGASRRAAPTSFLYGQEDFAAAVMRLTNDRGADVVYDGPSARRRFAKIDRKALAHTGASGQFSAQASGRTSALTRSAGWASRSITLSRPELCALQPMRPEQLRQQSAPAVLPRSAIVSSRSSHRRYIPPRRRAPGRMPISKGRRTTGALVLLPLKLCRDQGVRTHLRMVCPARKRGRRSSLSPPLRGGEDERASAVRPRSWRRRPTTLDRLVSPSHLDAIVLTKRSVQKTACASELGRDVMQPRALYVGIDLGTSNSTVCRVRR